MKKLIFSLMALMSILPATADRYLTLGANDTIRIKPSSLGGVQNVMVQAHFDGRLNHWDMAVQLPQGMRLLYATPRNDMLYIPYDSIQGNPSYCSAQFYCVENTNNILRDSLSATITVPGYWDPNGNGIYGTYGFVKWEAGDYSQMCELYFYISESFPDTASISVLEHLTSTVDLRGFTIPETTLGRIIHVYVGYMVGDVDGNEVINVADVTMLIDYILTGEGLDEYQLAAADVDGNGSVEIGDVTALTDIINLSGYNAFEDPSV